jgi:glycosyltransferase involved in cell wall biosynthesis
MQQEINKLSILMPVFNEARTLRTIFENIFAVNFSIPIEVIAVDDCSTDRSKDILLELAGKNPAIKPVFHSVNQGKGAAIATAIEQMTGDIAIIQDADLEYDPSDIPRVIKPILDGRADACFGSRFAGSEFRRVLYYWHSVANKFLTWLTNITCDLNLTDMETCYKAVKASILKEIPLRLKRFGIEPELTIRLAQWGARIYEVPVSYSGRTYMEGKKITWKDGILAIFAIVWAGFIDRQFTKHDGFYTLKVVSERDFNTWMFQQIRGFVGQRVLEAGCGVGNLSQFLLDKELITCVDIDRLYVEIIARRFGHLENFHAEYADLTSSDWNRLAERNFDTVICLNVLEHIDDDHKALENLFAVLRPGGRAVILVPQYGWLYGSLDESVGHFRRYSADTLSQKVSRAGFRVDRMQSFNKLGVLGWWLNGKAMKRKHLPKNQMKLFGMILPFAKLIEKVPFLPSLSVIIVAEKPLESQTLTKTESFSGIA